ncbi:MAG: ABC transporter permease subunit [Candidatus Faecivivens sp.]|nr:ABC transporter permease subunit [Oscillospiraceae bacterium]MDY2712850.1 ABC transporter permease subunit [Candidatus Faecivivens sp.]
MDQAAAKPKSNRKYSWQNIKKDFKKNKALFLMGLPTVAFFIIFCYIPMGGLLMAFENYKPNLGLLHSKFVGIANFQSFFQSIYFGRVLRNTIILSLLQLCIEFPFTILFALLLNELASQKYKRTVQTISYMPNFISMVVVAGIIVDFCSSDGAITSIVSLFTGSNQNLLSIPGYWRTIYVVSDLWQGVGFGSIIYVAALAGIDKSLYEAAEIDGANRAQRIWHITIPGIMGTIMIMLILRIGQMLSVGYEKTILMYNPQIYETADIISSFVYRKGLQESDYGYSTAVSLFNSVINFALLVISNGLSRKFTESSLF